MTPSGSGDGNSAPIQAIVLKPMASSSPSAVLNFCESDKKTDETQIRHQLPFDDTPDIPIFPTYLLLCFR